MRKFFTSVVLAAGLLSSPFLMADIVNLNQADAVTLQENLKGVGKKKAQAIVAYRDEHGDFKTLDEVMEVKGIGEGIFKKIKENLSLTEGVTGVSGKAGAKGESGAGMKSADSDSKKDKQSKAAKKPEEKSAKDKLAPKS